MLTGTFNFLCVLKRLLTMILYAPVSPYLLCRYCKYSRDVSQSIWHLKSDDLSQGGDKDRGATVDSG